MMQYYARVGKDSATTHSSLDRIVCVLASAVQPLRSVTIANSPQKPLPKVCKIMALMAIIMGLGPLFYILLGSRYCGSLKNNQYVPLRIL